MSVPNFLDKLTGKKPDEPKTYLALVLSDNRVQAAVWQVVINKTEIISLGTPVEWDGEVATTNELVQAVDATISSATEGLEVEPDEVILGLANNWVENQGIKPSKKDLIKSISKELSLHPIGYVVLSDTIVKYLKMQEGAPPTSILIQQDRKYCTLSLVELGRIKHTAVVSVTDNLSQDVAGGLKLIPQDAALPSRFILVSAMENTSDLVQTLTAYDWQKSFEFLHTPKIEALPKDVEVHATAVAGGSEVAASLGFSLDSPDEAVTDQEPTSPNPDVQPSAPEILGPESVGFVQASTHPVKQEEIETTDQEDDNMSSVDDLPSEPLPSVKKLPISLPSFKLPNFKLPKLRLPSLGGARPKSPYIVLGLAALLVASVVAWLYFVPRATITLQVQARPITESVAITLSSSAAELDVQNRTVPAVYSTKSIQGEDVVSVSGKKTIGDPARGEVTIYNRTTLPKTFLKGTTITADTLRFTLDSDVTVASKSAGADYVDVPGKANVKVTASSFGAAGNLKAGTEWTIASFTKDSFVAKNDAALTGGNSQDVTVVSASDQEALIDTLTTKLGTELADSLKLDTSITESHYVIPSDTKIVDAEYSSRVGDEATSLSATITLEFGVLTYNQQDIQQLLESTVTQAVPEGYLKSDINPEITLTKTTIEDNDDVSATAEVTLYVTPKLDGENLKSILKGKRYSQAETILSSLPGYVNSDITLTPDLPPRLLSLPYNATRIDLVVAPSK